MMSAVDQAAVAIQRQQYNLEQAQANMQDGQARSGFTAGGVLVFSGNGHGTFCWKHTSMILASLPSFSITLAANSVSRSAHRRFLLPGHRSLSAVSHLNHHEVGSSNQWAFTTTLIRSQHL